MGVFADEMLAAGRVEGPRILYLAWRFGGIDTDELREWILPTWSAAEWPVSGIGQRRWLEMFAATGFVGENGNGLPSPLTIYRGAALSHARGFSWTWRREQAKWFARRTARFGFPAGLFTVTLNRDMLLANVSSAGRTTECEVLVNPNRLRGRWTPRLLEVVEEEDEN